MKHFALSFLLLFIGVNSFAQEFMPAHISPSLLQVPSSGQSSQPFGFPQQQTGDQMGLLQYSQVPGDENCAVYQDYKPGYYYDTAGHKTYGLLQVAYSDDFLISKKGNCKLNYKANEDSNAIILNVLNTKSFVIETDSFTTLKNFKLNDIIYHEQDCIHQKDFVKVLEVGKINFYLFPTIVPKRQLIDNFTYENMKGEFVSLIEKNGKIRAVTKKNFSDVMKEYLDDYPELEAYIVSKNMTYSAKDTRTIVRIYNKHFKSLIPANN